MTSLYTKAASLIKLQFPTLGISNHGTAFIRNSKNDGDNYVKEVISLWDENLQDGEPLLVPIVCEGELVYSFPDMAAMQAKTKAELERLPERHKRLTKAEEYPVVLSAGLEDLLRQLRKNRQPQNEE